VLVLGRQLQLLQLHLLLLVPARLGEESEVKTYAFAEIERVRFCMA
jgi:hypothetical protein